jgi:hypothetical protein
MPSRSADPADPAETNPHLTAQFRPITRGDASLVNRPANRCRWVKGGLAAADLTARRPAAMRRQAFFVSRILEIPPMSIPAPERPRLLTDLELRQEDLLRQLDDLNRRIEQTVSQCRLRVEATSADLEGKPEV